MPRRAAITPNRSFHTTLPEDLAARLELALYSPVEGCVPRGAYQDWLCARIREWFDDKTLDLSPFIGELPGVHVVKGSPATLKVLLQTLNKESI